MLLNLFLWILFLPLLNSLILASASKYLGVSGVKKVTTSLLLFSTCLAWYLFYKNSLCFDYNSMAEVHYFSVYSWISVGSLQIDFEFVCDTLALVMCVTILTISTIVHLYSFYYLETDPYLARFLSYLSLFTFFMLILVCAANGILFFIGWEGVGVCSYLLISFWYKRVTAIKSAIKAILLNKIGDLSLLLALSLLTVYCGNVDVSFINGIYPFLENISISCFLFSLDLCTVISSLLVIAAIGKSAQLTFYFWLPDAMEGPTPVSALLHAATMVTAGAFLLMRFHAVTEAVSSIKLFLILAGGVTAFVAGLFSSVHTDLKKSIAFSTCSQLGYMFLACGLGCFEFCLFHLFNHAFFKALLFITTGNLIHITNSQDSREMSNIFAIAPLTFLYFFIANCSLMGLVNFSGYFSKEAILAQLDLLNILTLSTPYPLFLCFFLYSGIMVLGLSTAFLTAFYSFYQFSRMAGHSILLTISNLFVFLLSKGFIIHIAQKFRKTEIEYICFQFGLLTLAIFSLFGGFVFETFFTIHSSFDTNSIHDIGVNLLVTNDFTNHLDYIPVEESILDAIPIFLAIIGAILGILSERFNWQSAEIMQEFLIYISTPSKKQLSLRQLALLNHFNLENFAITIIPKIFLQIPIFFGFLKWKELKASLFIQVYNYLHINALKLTNIRLISAMTVMIIFIIVSLFLLLLFFNS